MPTIVITGIDTDIGKTVATGLLARYLKEAGVAVITQKIVQTGCTDVSDDIRLHRQLMGIDLMPEDHEGLTCPYLFPFPASPHLAARQVGITIMPEAITRATRQLEQNYDLVLLEGVGGMYVPLNDSLTLLDYCARQQYPLIVVSSSRLGSINHTLLTLEVARHRQLDVIGIIYNLDPDTSAEIADDSQQVFVTYLRRFGFLDAVIPMPQIDLEQELPQIDFEPLMQPYLGS
jgi:dethiobiotin synthetase